MDTRERNRTLLATCYGYSGKPYCQRCAHAVRDHIFQQKSNSAGCSRQNPCANYGPLLKSFSISGDVVENRGDEDQQEESRQKWDKDQQKERRRKREIQKPVALSAPCYTVPIVASKEALHRNNLFFSVRMNTCGRVVWPLSSLEMVDRSMSCNCV